MINDIGRVLCVLSRRQVYAPATVSLNRRTSRYYLQDHWQHTRNYSKQKVGIRRQNLAPFPEVEMVKNLDLETFKSSHFKNVKYGDYEFSESADGYVHVYVDASLDFRNPDACSGFAVYFGPEHPLNISGPVPGRQEIGCAKTYAALQGIKRVPTDTIQKVCICTDLSNAVSFIGYGVKAMSENSFRSERTGRLNKDLEMTMELNKVLRELNHIKWRVKYVPNNIAVDAMTRARTLADNAAYNATTKMRWEKGGGINLLEVME